MSNILHSGPPPLTIDAADAAIDYIDFMAATVRGVDLIDVTKKARKEWRAYLAGCYPNLAPTDRFWFANAAAQWSALRSMWPHYPPQMQEMLRQQWAAGIGATLQFISPVFDSAPDAPAYEYDGGQQAYGYGAAQPQPYGGNPYAGSYGGYGQRGGSYDDLMATILANQDRQEQEAAKRSPEEQMQVRAQNNAINAQMLSGISRMGFEASMAIARNFK